mmetsp:Transcript_12040/g.10641  ORF Transcript_12040/g.10641 Transcript_12040/m.10641 type:complete len:326 (+) Transcript_12040:40-1017(+)|eukprot:CAMPEP_0205803724 /NCGR_PEP_ID=MMETSP0205-20121125/6455_1 /ASSEMBLY_ACC=CAM_ASM_000278 /TAXON_ID=36767 /ORGANISM="Euplotes focardii, Strain TN1" /LENGTH=325 /DNA_ID=CAMNT_0053072243 /DNA_START=11 /DNA_END=988 /DNA_ORIENTATION=+
MKVIALFLVFLIVFSAVKAEKTQEVVDTIEGILEGAFGKEGTAAVECIEDGEVLFLEFEEGIKELAKGGTKNIIDGLFHIGKGLEELPKEFAECEAAEAIIPDLEHIVAEFKDPKSLVVHVGKEVLWNGKSVYKDINGAVSEFHDGHFKEAGADIGDIINILLVKTVAKSVGEPAKDVLETVEGLLVGAFGTEGKEAVVCLQDGEEIVKDIELAIKEFSQGGTTHIVKGLFFIGEALEELPKEFEACEEAEGLLVDFEKIIAEFKNPTELAVHVGKEVLWHGKNIYSDISEAETHFNAGEFEPAGENIGDIVRILLVEKLIKSSA